MHADVCTVMAWTNGAFLRISLLKVARNYIKSQCTLNILQFSYTSVRLGAGVKENHFILTRISRNKTVGQGYGEIGILTGYC